MASAPHPSEVPFSRLASNQSIGKQDGVLEILQNFQVCHQSSSFFEHDHPAFDVPSTTGNLSCKEYKDNLAHISVTQILSGAWDFEDDEESGCEEDLCGYMNTVPGTLGDQLQTTLMIRNIPLMYTQEMLLREWPNYGNYDFLYLPCVTYAFVNFTSPNYALDFMSKWQQARLHRGKSKRALNISFAAVQGLVNNLKRWKKKRTWRFNHRCKPFVFQDGYQVSLEDMMLGIGMV